jgi:hypothetical protein
MATEHEPPPDDRSGLCPDCAHVKIVTSQRGSIFLLCLLSAEDPRFSKYPPQPVVSCEGFEG